LLARADFFMVNKISARYSSRNFQSGAKAPNARDRPGRWLAHVADHRVLGGGGRDSSRTAVGAAREARNAGERRESRSGAHPAGPARRQTDPGSSSELAVRAG